LKTKEKLWALAAAAIVLAGCSSPTNRSPIVIESAEITVTAPVTGATPATAATVGADADFTASEVTWNPVHGAFEGETVYTATVTLTANAEHTFAGGLTTATINGQDATVSYNTGATVTLALAFAATAPGPGADPDPGPDATVIASAAIIVTAPVTGETPDTEAAAGAGANFTVGAVTWNPAHDTFEGETEYTATVTLAANAGHTFTGGLATATINGQDATVTGNTGATVTLALAFAATEPDSELDPDLDPDATVIASAAITVTAPATGATPVTTATAGTGANFAVGAVTWNPAHSPFEGGTVYTATVTLTANAGHTFTGGLATATINGQAATVSNNTGATATLALAFAATEPGLDPDLVLAAWQFGTADGTAPSNNQAVNASIIEDENASRPSGGQQAETARLRFWVSPGGELTQRALNGGSSGINVRNAAGDANGELDGLANNAWWQTEISTTGRANIAVTWRMRSTNTGPRDWRLQYRVGGDGGWNNVGGTIALPSGPDASTLNAPEQGRFLPTSAEGHERLYLRWLMTSNVAPNGNPIQPGGTHQINDLVIRFDANPADFDNQDDPPPQTGTININWTGFTNPLLAAGVSISGGAAVGAISVNAPEGAFTSIEWLNHNMQTIGTAATLAPPSGGFPPLVTVRVRTEGSDRTYSIVFDTVTGAVFN